jgi:hypothetical protein
MNAKRGQNYLHLPASCARLHCQAVSHDLSDTMVILYDDRFQFSQLDLLPFCNCFCLLQIMWYVIHSSTVQ